MKPKLLQSEPHKVYTINLNLKKDVNELCDFLKEIKDKRLDVIINNKKHLFTSKAGRIKFVSGLETGFKIGDVKLTDTPYKKSSVLKSKLRVALNEKEKLDKKCKEFSNKYMVKYELLSIREKTWKDKILELRDDLRILNEELKRIKDDN